MIPTYRTLSFVDILLQALDLESMVEQGYDVGKIRLKSPHASCTTVSILALLASLGVLWLPVACCTQVYIFVVGMHGCMTGMTGVADWIGELVD